MDLGPANLGSIPTDTHMSHWWWQEGHLAKIAPVHHSVCVCVCVNMSFCMKSQTQLNLGSPDDDDLEFEAP